MCVSCPADVFEETGCCKFFPFRRATRTSHLALHREDMIPVCRQTIQFVADALARATAGLQQAAVASRAAAEWFEDPSRLCKPFWVAVRHIGGFGGVHRVTHGLRCRMSVACHITRGVERLCVASCRCRYRSVRL